jgi:heat shock protein HtpX
VAAEPDRSVGRFELPEALSPSGSLLLARAFRTHYLGPRVPADRPPGLAASEDPSTGAAEFEWSLDPVALGVSRPDRPSVAVRIRARFDPSRVTLELRGPGLTGPEAERALTRVTDELRAFVSRYLRIERAASFYLAIPMGPAGRPRSSGGHAAVRRIFAGNSTNAFLLIVLLSVPAVLLLGLYAFVLMIGLQAVVVAFADRLALGSAPVRPTQEKPWVAIVGVTVDPEQKVSFRKTARAALPRLRERLAELIGPTPGPAEIPTVVGVLRGFGIACSEADVRLTRRNVHERVASVARRFGTGPPKIVVTDQPLSNAAATGPSPGRATISITAGSIEQLPDPQLDAVIGHELGHLRGRDPVVLFSVNAVLYLGAVFLWLPVLLYLGLFYILLAFVILYAVGKVLETRADTFSALVLGRPGDLAAALEAGAFDEELVERRSYLGRVFGWLSLDSHPPLYFRVRRLFQASHGAEATRHPLLSSARDCLVGFVSALSGVD